MLRNGARSCALALLLVAPYRAMSEQSECADDGDCDLANVQLLQQDISLNKDRRRHNENAAEALLDSAVDQFFRGVLSMLGASTAGHAGQPKVNSAVSTVKDDPTPVEQATEYYQSLLPSKEPIPISEMTKEQLQEFEKELVETIKVQAMVVSNATDSYLNAAVLNEIADDKTDNAADDLKSTDRQNETASFVNSTVADAIALAKLKRDQTLNARDAAKETYETVKPQYEEAQRAYLASLGPIPLLENKTNETKHDAEDAQRALDASAAAKAAADADVARQSTELQGAIDELNVRNEDLTDVQSEIGRPVEPV